MTKGIFDGEKEDFTMPGTASGTVEASQEATIAKAAGMLNESKSSSGTDVVTEAEESIADISDEDEELAEQMLFKGYAEKDIVIPIFRRKGTYITVCTSSPQDMSIINYALFDFLNKNGGENGEKVPDIELQTLKGMYTLALGYMGVNGVDVCEDHTVSKLSVLKMAIRKMNENYSKGEIKIANDLKESIIEALNYRVSTIKLTTTAVLDFVRDSRYDFEEKMFNLMSQEAIIPK